MESRYIQLAHDYNYKEFGDYVNDPKVYELGYSYVAENYAWEAAGWFWMKNNLNSLVDQGASVAQITKVVRGSSETSDERQVNYDLVRRIRG
jgi:predicted chitinase